MAAFAVAVAIGGAAVAAERRVTEQGITSTIVDGQMIPQSLTGKPGDPDRGRKSSSDRKLGNCLACHQLSVLADERYHGNVGPSLNGVASRVSEGEMRLQIVKPKLANPDTIMLAFFRSTGLHDVLKKLHGKTILTAEQVKDVIAFFKTLK